MLPAAAWVEREGTFTNFEGRVQRFRTAVEPLGEALAEWDLLGRVLAAARRRHRPAPAPSTGSASWRARCRAFAGMTYQSVGDGGQLVAGATSAGAPVPPGRRPRVPA